MEFILQLLAQLFSAPVENGEAEAVKKEVVEAPVLEEKTEEQLEPNFFNVLDFH
jgi:hypothetical protein